MTQVDSHSETSIPSPNPGELTDVFYCGTYDNKATQRDQLLLEVSKGALGWYGGYSIQYCLTGAFDVETMPIGVAMHLVRYETPTDISRQLSHSRIVLYVPHDGAKPNESDPFILEAVRHGALLLTPAYPSLEPLFTPDRDIVTFNSPQEAIEKIRWLLDHPIERGRIASAGRLRAIRI